MYKLKKYYITHASGYIHAEWKTIIIEDSISKLIIIIYGFFLR